VSSTGKTAAAVMGAKVAGLTGVGFGCCSLASAAVVVTVMVEVAVPPAVRVTVGLLKEQVASAARPEQVRATGPLKAPTEATVT
jgi:hypothetical protein